MKNFGHQIKFWFRKKIITLKRNFYIVPFLLVAIALIIFLCSLDVFSPVFVRSSVNKYDPILIFISTLIGILGAVSYLNVMNHSKVKLMSILFFSISVLVILIDIILLKDVNGFIDYSRGQLNLELVKPAEEVLDANVKYYNENIRWGNHCVNIFVWHIVMTSLSIVIAALAPFIQKALKKVKLSPIAYNGK